MKYVTFGNSHTRHSSTGKLNMNHCRTSTTRHSYFNCVVFLWNAIPNCWHISAISFYQRLHLFRPLKWRHFTKRFDPNNPCTFSFVCPCASCYYNVCHTSINLRIVNFFYLFHRQHHPPWCLSFTTVQSLSSQSSYFRLFVKVCCKSNIIIVIFKRAGKK